jgi:hypothetical protein
MQSGVKDPEVTDELQIIICWHGILCFGTFFILTPDSLTAKQPPIIQMHYANSWGKSETV